MRTLTTRRSWPAMLVLAAVPLLGCGSEVDSPIPTELTPDTTAEEPSNTGGS